MLTVFLIAGAIGGFAGGAAADRLGRDRVVIGSLLLSVPFGVALGLLGEFGRAFWLAAGACGFFLNGSWISLTVRGQESVPGSIAMMSGLMLGLSIGLGGIAVAPIGLLAEHFGLGVVLVSRGLPAAAGGADDALRARAGQPLAISVRTSASTRMASMAARVSRHSRPTGGTLHAAPPASSRGSGRRARGYVARASAPRRRGPR